jgi:hypothetical protein
LRKSASPAAKPEIFKLNRATPDAISKGVRMLQDLTRAAPRASGRSGPAKITGDSGFPRLTTKSCWRQPSSHHDACGTPFSSGLLDPRGVLRGVSQPLFSEAHFSTHHMEHKDFGSLESVKDAAGWFHDLAVWRVGEFSYYGATFWVFSELLNMGKDPLDKCFCRVRLVQSNEVSDRV